jgi:hypothetical protein
VGIGVFESTEATRNRFYSGGEAEEWNQGNRAARDAQRLAAKRAGRGFGGLRSLRAIGLPRGIFAAVDPTSWRSGFIEWNVK